MDSLAGKDYFTVAEAAAYACVSESQFRAKADEYGLPCFKWMGKTVYARADLREAMERERWQQCGSGDGPGISNGPRAGGSSGKAWAASLVPKPSGPRR